MPHQIQIALDRIKIYLVSICHELPAASKLTKDAINAAFHAQGFENVQRAAFNAYHLTHTQYRLHQDGSFMDRSFTPGYKAQTKAE